MSAAQRPDPSSGLTGKQIAQQTGGIFLGIGGGFLIVAVHGAAAVVAGAVFVLAGATLFVAPAWPWVLPVGVERDYRGVVFRPQRPRLTRYRLKKERLKTETLALVSEVFAYLKSQPSEFAFWGPEREEMQAAKDEEERSRIWRKYRAAEDQLRDRQQLEMAELFGGRVRYLATQYARRGLLTVHEAEHIEWELGSTHWIKDVAQKLESLAHAL